MIEIAQPEYWKKQVTYEEAVIYCFSLNIDGKTNWRLPTRTEYFETDMDFGWYQSKKCPGFTLQVYPVRDLDI